MLVLRTRIHIAEDMGLRVKNVLRALGLRRHARGWGCGDMHSGIAETIAMEKGHRVWDSVSGEGFRGDSAEGCYLGKAETS